MQPDGLFDLNPPTSGSQGFVTPSSDSPLAVRMRPRSIDELVGQDHLLAPGAPLSPFACRLPPVGRAPVC